MFSHYNLLEVSPTASAVDIEKAFKKARVIWHPDKSVGYGLGQQKEAFGEMFKAVTAAHAILSNPSSRIQYDQSLKNPSDEAKTSAELLEATKTILMRRIKKFEEKNLQKQLADQQQEINGLQNTITQLQNEIASLKQKNTELTTQQAADQQIIAKLKAENTSSQKRTLLEETNTELKKLKLDNTHTFFSEVKNDTQSTKIKPEGLKEICKIFEDAQGPFEGGLTQVSLVFENEQFGLALRNKLYKHFDKHDIHSIQLFYPSNSNPRNQANEFVFTINIKTNTLAYWYEHVHPELAGYIALAEFEKYVDISQIPQVFTHYNLQPYTKHMLLPVFQNVKIAFPKGMDGLDKVEVNADDSVMILTFTNINTANYALELIRENFPSTPLLFTLYQNTLTAFHPNRQAALLVEVDKIFDLSNETTNRHTRSMTRNF